VLSHNSDNRDVVLLGMRDEILSIDFMYVNDEEVACIMEFVHKIAWQELISRTILSMAEWSSHAKTVFINHSFSQVGHIIILTKDEVNRLYGCGYMTRKEIFEVFKSYGIVLSGWEPGHYYEKRNCRYKFIDDEIKYS